MTSRSYAVIPAAGRGTRLGLDRPKILAPLNDDETIWSVLRDKLLAVVDRVHVVQDVIVGSELERLAEEFRHMMPGEQLLERKAREN